MELIGAKIIQKCPHCGFIFNLNEDKITSDWNIDIKDVVRQTECPKCKQSIVLCKFFKETEKTKFYERFKKVYTELDIMQRDFLQHCAILYKKKVVFKDFGCVIERKYGNKLYNKMYVEAIKSGDKSFFDKRNRERTYGWAVETTVWNNDKVEFKIKRW